MSDLAPIIYVLAGPNGAGKTSLYKHEAADIPRLGMRYINSIRICT